MRADNVGITGKSMRILAALCVCAGLSAAGCKKDQLAVPAAGKTPEPAKTEKAAKPAAAKADPKKVLVTVFGNTLTQGKVDEQMERMLSSPQMQNMPPEMLDQARERMSKDIVDRFVTRTVLLHEAEARKCEVTDKERDDEIANIKSSLPEGMTLESAIAMNGGGDMAEFRKQLAEDMKIRKMVDAATESAPAPTDDEIKTFYTNSPSSFQMPEHVRVQHILIKCDPKAADAEKAEKRKKIEGLREQLVKGADFAELAKANSDCPSKSRGGDLGRLTKGKTVPPFEAAAFSQEVNAIGPVVETDFGFHVIKVLGKHEAGMLKLEEVKDELSQYLKESKRRTAADDLIKKLKNEAKIEYGKQS